MPRETDSQLRTMDHEFAPDASAAAPPRDFTLDVLTAGEWLMISAAVLLIGGAIGHCVREIWRSYSLEPVSNIEPSKTTEDEL